MIGVDAQHFQMMLVFFGLLVSVFGVQDQAKKSKNNFLLWTSSIGLLALFIATIVELILTFL